MKAKASIESHNAPPLRPWQLQKTLFQLSSFGDKKYLKLCMCQFISFVLSMPWWLFTFTFMHHHSSFLLSKQQQASGDCSRLCLFPCHSIIFTFFLQCSYEFLVSVHGNVYSSLFYHYYCLPSKQQRVYSDSQRFCLFINSKHQKVSRDCSHLCYLLSFYRYYLLPSIQQQVSEVISRLLQQLGCWDDCAICWNPHRRAWPTRILLLVRRGVVALALCDPQPADSVLVSRRLVPH